MKTNFRSFIYLFLPVGVAIIFLLALFLAMPVGSLAAETNAPQTVTTSVIYQESFETDGEGVRYTTSNFFNDGTSDHYSRTNGTDISNVTAPYSSYDGTYFWAAEDTDDDGGDGLDVKTMVLTPVDISSYSNIQFKGLFGVGNENPAGASNYDALDYAIVYYSVDGSSFTKGLEFRYVRDADDYNEPLAQDTNFDGIGDGTLLGTEMQEFAFTIPSGNSVVISITVSFDSASEEFGFDNLRIENVPDILLLTEIAVTPTDGEFIEIFNPGSQEIDLSNVYLTDATYAGGSTYYYNIVTGSNAGGGGNYDFHARFPDGASIGAGDYQVVAIAGSDAFSNTYGIAPTYELYEDGASPDSIPDMREALSGSINNQGGLTNGGEVVILYSWDGMTDLVTDLDYVIWVDKAEGVDKTGIFIDGPDADVITSTYQADTALASQDVVASAAHASGNTWQREDLSEGTETLTGGNGSDGHDETSENLSTTWCEELPSPLQATPCGSDTAPTVSSTTPADNEIDVALNTNISIDFSENVTVTGTWYDISCASSGAHSAVVSGGPQNFTLNPDAEFSANEVCTVTVYAAQVTDQDGTADNMASDYVFDFTTLTPECGNAATFIHAIQGTGMSSPEDGNIHTIEGVVVGDFQTSDHLRGFFVQEEDADADSDPMTSEGIFVYDGSTPAVDVNEGDLVRVTGTVDEYLTPYNGGPDDILTELTNITYVEICPAGGTASAAIPQLPVTNVDDWEWYEGMLVHITQTLYATGNYYQGRYGEVDLSINSRLDSPTNVVEPGAAAIALQDLNDRSRIQLEDGRTSQNSIPPAYIGDGGTLRAGDTLPELTGVLHFSYAYYEIHPTEAITFTRVNTREATPPDVGGTLKVASFNVLNYFTSLDDGSCPYAGGCRGADTEEEFTRQRTKIITAVLTMDADVIGLMEIENHPNDFSTQDLVNGLNAIAGAGTYAFINTNAIGTDSIKVALVYKPSKVTPVGAYAILDSSVDAAFLDTKNRPVLAQTFADVATGQKFTIAVNHLKSKGSDCDDVNDPDTGDGQGNCNLTRTTAATALVNWLATDPTSSGNNAFLIIGDLNSHAKEDPIDAIKAGGYTDLLEALINPYSYVFMGQAGYLDHALANANMMAQVTGVTIWHINTDEPAALDYNDYNQPSLYNPDQYRASDHDPIIVGLDLRWRVILPLIIK